MTILWSKKQTIDLGRAGHLSGLHPSLTSLDLRTLHDTMAAFAMAQAMLQGIGGGQTEGALTVRKIIPSLDLVDNFTTPGTDTTITASNWRQPPGLTSFYATQTGADTEAVSTYLSTKNSNNDKKVIIMYGLRAVGVGNQHNGTIVKSVQWQFWRKGTKLIDRWYIEQLNSAPECFVAAITPIMFKKDDIGEIKIIPDAFTASDANKYDRLEILGVVSEPIGLNTIG